jgi:hypothetical protein
MTNVNPYGFVNTHNVHDINVQHLNKKNIDVKKQDGTFDAHLRKHTSTNKKASGGTKIATEKDEETKRVTSIIEPIIKSFMSQMLIEPQRESFVKFQGDDIILQKRFIDQLVEHLPANKKLVKDIVDHILRNQGQNVSKK